MTANSLGKLYDRLTPWERVRAIIAAEKRGDENERTRLWETAPRICYSEPYMVVDLIQMLFLMASFYRADLLTSLAWFNYCMDCGNQLADDDAFDVEQQSKLWRIGKFHAFLFYHKLDTWRAVCAELEIDADRVLPSVFPGGELGEESEPRLREWAFTPEQAADYLKTMGDEMEYATPAECAKAIRQRLAEHWEI